MLPTVSRQRGGAGTEGERAGDEDQENKRDHAPGRRGGNRRRFDKAVDHFVGDRAVVEGKARFLIGRERPVEDDFYCFDGEVLTTAGLQDNGRINAAGGGDGDLVEVNVVRRVEGDGEEVDAGVDCRVEEALGRVGGNDPLTEGNSSEPYVIPFVELIGYRVADTAALG